MLLKAFPAFSEINQICTNWIDTNHVIVFCIKHVLHKVHQWTPLPGASRINICCSYNWLKLNYWPLISGKLKSSINIYNALRSRSDYIHVRKTRAFITAHHVEKNPLQRYHKYKVSAAHATSFPWRALEVVKVTCSSLGSSFVCLSASLSGGMESRNYSFEWFFDRQQVNGEEHRRSVYGLRSAVFSPNRTRRYINIGGK